MRRPRVLSVGSDPTIVKLLRINLEVRGCKTLVAKESTKALQVTQREQPDLVILDTKIPDVDDFELCHKLREQKQIPVIVLSNRCDVKDKVEFLTHGADYYITKPFSIVELVAHVRAVFRRTKSTFLTLQLRAKIEPDPTNPKYIVTVPGRGYQFRDKL